MGECVGNSLAKSPAGAKILRHIEMQEPQSGFEQALDFPVFLLGFPQITYRLIKMKFKQNI